MAKPAKSKYYVVWNGRTPGIYTTWDAASLQVSGYRGAKYKSFPSRDEAERAFQGDYSAYVGTSAPKARAAGHSLEELAALGVRLHSVAVDAACSGVPGPMEYRGVYVESGSTLFHAGPYEDGTNNVGEFLALVEALQILQHEGQTDLPIYSDSVNAQLWVRAGKCRTWLQHTSRNQVIFDLIAHAESWLGANPITNPILKWETDRWGEIPADFGRK